MKKVIHLLLFVCLASIGVSQAQQSFSSVIAFGDSLSDTGNLASVTISFPYPFYNNRVSDGPVALDYFSEALGFNADASLHLDPPLVGFNYAVAGGNVIGNDVEDMTRQVTAHLERVDGAADPLALYVVIMGSNDIRAVRSISSSSVANAEIELVVDQLMSQLLRLSDAGATQFFVTNVGNVGRIPETLQREAEDPGVSARATVYTQTYNGLLATRLESFAQQTGANIVLFDIFSELEQIISNAAQFGFTYTDVGCFVELEFHPGCVFGTRFDRFVFFDNLHPTSTTHQIIAAAMLEKVSELNPEPDPDPDPDPDPEPDPEPDPSPVVVPLAAIMLLLDD